MNDGVGAVISNPREVIVHFLNYLNVSFYEAQFTKKHEEARANLNAIYDDAVAATDETTPLTKAQLVSFYNDICVLENVTDTSDPIYYTYKRLLRRCITAMEPKL